jgi:hypothetical protein
MRVLVMFYFVVREDLPMHLVHNERTKLTAGWLNTLATALVAAGFFAPAAALLYGLSRPPAGYGYIVALVLGCLALGVGLHLLGRLLLGGLRE